MSADKNLRKRLDQILIDKNLVPDIDTGRRLIGAGEVYVDEVITDKVGTLVKVTSAIRLKERSPFVSRGGLKLQQAIECFSVQVGGKICLDVGASTGGFTDCLLQYGATKVYAVDVAYGQLAWKLRQDPRVMTLERCNARHLAEKNLLDEAIQLAVTDVSFISLTKILPAMISSFSSQVEIIALIKPQFELSREDIPSGGVVSDPLLHIKAVEKITTFISDYPSPLLCIKGILPSPILGPKGNREFLIHIISRSYD